MLRLLVIEDKVEYYEDYLLRIFDQLLPMEQINITHVPTLQAALVALLEPWDVIFVDYTLGPKAEFLGEAVRSGADLIRFRRAVEAGGIPAAYIVGTCANDVGNRFLMEQGANDACLKISVEDLAKTVQFRLGEK